MSNVKCQMSKTNFLVAFSVVFVVFVVSPALALLVLLSASFLLFSSIRPSTLPLSPLPIIQSPSAA
jgi:hypothetical protein